MDDVAKNRPDRRARAREAVASGADPGRMDTPERRRRLGRRFEPIPPPVRDPQTPSRDELAMSRYWPDDDRLLADGSPSWEGDVAPARRSCRPSDAEWLECFEVPGVDVSPAGIERREVRQERLRRGGLAGGYARAAALTPEERSAIAAHANSKGRPPKIDGSIVADVAARYGIDPADIEAFR